MKLYWVSFLDGMQRVILFTEDIAIMMMAQQVVTSQLARVSGTLFPSTSLQHLLCPLSENV